jgi:hypothetical protein
MPISEYFKGKGEQVMAALRKRYGAERGERIFYALAKARGMEPPYKQRRPRVRKIRIR